MKNMTYAKIACLGQVAQPTPCFFSGVQPDIGSLPLLRPLFASFPKHYLAERCKTVPYNSPPPCHDGLAQRAPPLLRAIYASFRDVRFNPFRFVQVQEEEPDLGAGYLKFVWNELPFDG
jgi:hypothetical protein